jgi:hypothetical protein
LHDWNSTGKKLATAIREQARFAYRGSKFTNEAAPIVNEYSTRIMLAKLGYTSDISRLSLFKANCFSIIESEIAKERDRQMKRRK